MKQNISPLVNIGLTEKQALVYNALVDLGEATISETAKYAQLKRPTVYLIIEELINLSLVSLLEKNTKKLYSAAHPQRIAELLDSRKKQFDELLPVLLARSGSYGNKPKIQMLEGLSGVKHAYQEAYKLLSEGKHNEGLWFGNISFLLDNFPEVISEYDKILEPLKEYRIREIITGGDKSKRWVKKMENKTRSFHFIKYLNDNNQTGMTDRFIIGNKIILFSMNKDIFTLIIESEELVKTERFMFDLIWGGL